MKQRKDSKEIYENANRFDLAKKEELELSILSTYLPQMFTEKDIKILIENIIKETGAESLSDIGKVMPIVIKRGAGKIDGRIANSVLRDLLE